MASGDSTVSTLNSEPGEASQSARSRHVRGSSHSNRTCMAGVYLAGVHRIIPGPQGLPDIHELGLYSGTDSLKILPPIPFEGGIIRSKCQCISLAGKIYLLGGVDPWPYYASKEVYVFHLADWQWTRCARMNEGRMNFGVGVIHGKIYVSGGMNMSAPVRGSEVYDPQVNTWSSAIEDIPDSRIDHKIAAVQEELCVFGGRNLDEHLFGKYDFPSTLQYYHPRKNEWTWTEIEGGKHWLYNVFMVQETFYRLTNSGIDVQHDFLQTPWTPLQSFSEGLLDGRNVVLKLGHQSILLRDGSSRGELLIVSHVSSHTTTEGAYLLRTRGFNNGNKTVKLEMAVDSIGKIDEGSTIIFPLDW